MRFYKGVPFLLRGEEWGSPQFFLLLLAAGQAFTHVIWIVLLNNFAVSEVHFDGQKIGILQSLREIPGFLAFTVVFALLIIREQTLIAWSLLVMGVGVALTGFLPSVWGLYFTTVIMSIGFHYYETLNQSLCLQWISKVKLPTFLAKQVSIKALASIGASLAIWVFFSYVDIGFTSVYFVAGLGLAFISCYALVGFREFVQPVQQTKGIVLKWAYFLFYCLTFLAGARRQIFIVFAGFLLVEKFKLDPAMVGLLHFCNYMLAFATAHFIGKLVERFGERNILMLEYGGLAIVFSLYAIVDNILFAAVLYLVDHLLFSMSIALKSYFQKIAAPEDFASSASISFTINHIAAVFIPALLGVLWLYSSALVFLIGAGLALASMMLASRIPKGLA